MHPGTEAEGTFLVYQNYHTLLHWNKSRYFATAAGLLADEIAK
jgi:membrane-bound lytic murein transglycosylase B